MIFELKTQKIVSTDQLTVGAKINRLFHERLPLHIAERKIDEKHLRREIKIVIQNIRGVRSGQWLLETLITFFWDLILKKPFTGLLRRCISI